ncbi:MAG: hypothetical protein ACLU7D_09540 [Collinsella sp.]
MKWKLLPLIILMTALTAFAAAGGEQTRVLIVDGFSNHDWKRTTACLTELLARHGGYSVDVSTFPAGAPQEEREAWNPDSGITT